MAFPYLEKIKVLDVQSDNLSNKVKEAFVDWIETRNNHGQNTYHWWYTTDYFGNRTVDNNPATKGMSKLEIEKYYGIKPCHKIIKEFLDSNNITELLVLWWW